MATQQSIQLRNQSTQSLIASGAKASLPRFGVLHKGEKAQRSSTGDITRPGKDLSYFRLDTKFPDIEAVWNKAYPDDAAKRRINVIMPFATVDENFERCREQWVKGGLVHRCDGVTTSRMRDKQTGKMSLEPQDCPGGCELVSRMMVMIPEMIVGTLRLGLFTLNDTSKNDIARLKEELQWIYDARGSLQGVPMILYRTEEMISQPKSDTDVSRVRRAKWMVHIEAGPEFAKSLIRGMTQEAIAAPTRAAIAGTQRRLSAAPAPIANGSPIDTSGITHEAYGDDEPEPPASDFGEQPGDENDGAIDAEPELPPAEFISGELLERATDLTKKLTAEGVTVTELASVIENVAGVKKIEHVAAGDAKPLIAALAQALSTKLASKTKKKSPFAPE